MGYCILLDDRMASSRDMGRHQQEFQWSPYQSQNLWLSAHKRLINSSISVERVEERLDLYQMTTIPVRQFLQLLGRIVDILDTAGRQYYLFINVWVLEFVPE